MAVGPQANQIPVFTGAPLLASGITSATADASLTAPTVSVTVVDATQKTIASVVCTQNSQVLSSANAFTGVRVGDMVVHELAASQVVVGSRVTAIDPTNKYVWIDQAITASTATVTLQFIPNGAKIEEVVVEQITTPSVSQLITLYLYDGTTYWAFDSYTISASNTVSSTVAPLRTEKVYSDLIVPDGWKLVASGWAASMQCNVIARGGWF